MSRTPAFRLFRRWFPLPQENLAGDIHFLPAAGRDSDPGEAGFLSVAAGVGYIALVLTVLKQVLPAWAAALLAVPVVFLFWQVLILLLALIRGALNGLGLCRTGHPQDFHAPCHLLLLTILAVLGLNTQYCLPALVWLGFAAVNLACAALEFVLKPASAPNAPPRNS